MDMKNTKPIPLEPHRGRDADTNLGKIVPRLADAGGEDSGHASKMHAIETINSTTRNYAGFYNLEGDYVTVVRNMNAEGDVGIGAQKQALFYPYSIYVNDDLKALLEREAGEAFISRFAGVAEDLEVEIANGSVSWGTAKGYRDMLDAFAGLAKPGTIKLEEEKQPSKAAAPRADEYELWGMTARMRKEGDGYSIEISGQKEARIFIYSDEIKDVRDSLAKHAKNFRETNIALHGAIYNGYQIQESVARYREAKGLCESYIGGLGTRDMTRPSGITPAIPH